MPDGEFVGASPALVRSLSCGQRRAAPRQPDYSVSARGVGSTPAPGRRRRRV